MKTENLMKASESFYLFGAQLRESYNDALNSNDKFAAMVIYALATKVTRIGFKLETIKKAAIASDPETPRQ